MKNVKFINQRIYTDVRSWKVYDIDEKSRTATAIEVERIKNQGEPVPKYGAEPFKITQNKDGVWGVTVEKLLWSVPMEAVNKQWLEENKDKPEIEIDGKWVRVFELTTKGKKKHYFEKLGKLADYCGYFYDYSF